MDSKTDFDECDIWSLVSAGSSYGEDIGTSNNDGFEVVARPTNETPIQAKTSAIPNYFEILYRPLSMEAKISSTPETKMPPEPDPQRRTRAYSVTTPEAKQRPVDQETNARSMRENELFELISGQSSHRKDSESMEDISPKCKPSLVREGENELFGIGIKTDATAAATNRCNEWATSAANYSPLMQVPEAKRTDMIFISIPMPDAISLETGRANGHGAFTIDDHPSVWNALMSVYNSKEQHQRATEGCVDDIRQEHGALGMFRALIWCMLNANTAGEDIWAIARMSNALSEVGLEKQAWISGLK